MHRDKIRRLLTGYPIISQADKINLIRTRRFVEENPNCFERTLSIGHLTGSAWIVSPDRAWVLLTHHQKLARWLQPGGHADGDPDLIAVALREIYEETGLTKLHPLSKHIFDIDIHQIPATETEAAHYHYDVRFIFEAAPTDPLVVSSESKALAWISVDKLHHYNADLSILRMADKTTLLS